MAIGMRFTELDISGGDLSGGPSVSFEDIAYAPELGVWVAVGALGAPATTCMRSVDGTNWTFPTMPTGALWSGVVWSPELGIFAACSNSAVCKIATSPDGITWSIAFAVSPQNTHPSRCIEWSPDLGLFICGSAASTGTPTATTRFMTSPDAINWTLITGTPDRAVEAIRWSPELSLFVAACSDFGGGLDAMWTSPTGAVWTPRNLPDAFFIDASAGSHTLLTWADDLGLFVCVRDGGSVVTSPDGINWSVMTPSTDPDAGEIRGVAWAQRLGLLIFTGLDDSFGTKPIHYSEDGATIHTVDYAGPNSRAWYFPAYSAQFDVMPIVRAVNGYAVLLVSFGPELVEVTPAYGDNVGGNTVQLIGTGFEDGMEVVFDLSFATDVVVLSPTLATCVVPPHVATGFVNVTVTNPDDRYDVGELLYEYREPIDPATGEPEIFPEISWMGSGCAPGSIVPDHGTMAGGTLVTIHGQGFKAASSVYFGGELATIVENDSEQPWPALVLAKGPDAWWRLEEESAALVLVDEMGAHDATMSTARAKTSVRGGLSYSASKGIALAQSSLGVACVLSNTADFSPGIPLFQGAGTIEFLLRPAAGGPQYGFVIGDTDFCNGIYVFDTAGDIRVSFESDISGFADQTNSAPLVAGQLYHVALKLDGAGGGQWVIDGVADATITQVNTAPTADVAFLFEDGGFALTCELLDELAVYDVDLSVATLLTHATTLDADYPALVLADGAIAYWRFEEDAATATILEDSTGNGFDADTVPNGSRTSVSGGLDDGHVHAVVNPGIVLSGAYSIEFLINPIDIGALQVVLNEISPDGFFVDTDLKLRAEKAHTLLSDVPLVAGAISHVIFTASGSTGRWYINSVEHGSGAWDNTDDLILQRLIGGTVGQNPLVCNVLDEVVVHSVELSAADVLAHYQAARQWVSGTFITVITPPHQTGAVDVEVVSP